MSLLARGICSEVRELLNDDRRLLRLRSLRTPVDGLLWICSGEGGCAAEAGDMGVRKLSFRVSAISATPYFSCAGQAPGMSTGVAG